MRSMRATQPADASSSLFLLNCSIAASANAGSLPKMASDRQLKEELLNTLLKGKRNNGRGRTGRALTQCVSLSLSHTHTHTITSSHSFLPRTNELKEKTYIYALKNERSAGLKGTE
jgi:hypothetical protein|uniref:Uncharacterized protein n=1 Tax=Zea mays TaxID=4577 RepID=C4J2S5_MAIZE|nr:unknown [Zea mays]ACR36714.1 unknown [Zea mays]